MTFDKSDSAIHVAVIEGAHPFDVPAWHRLFRRLPNVVYYPQPLENWLADWGNCRNDYDAALFYNMHMAPADDPLSQGVNDALTAFTESGGGVCILHHALIAFPGNPAWEQAVGLSDRSLSYYVDQELTVSAASTEHPISCGISPFALRDETYVMQNADPANGNEILFTTAYEKSMQTLGWTRTMNQGRVFCLQSGHDNQVWAVPAFGEIIGRALHWIARR